MVNVSSQPAFPLAFIVLCTSDMLLPYVLSKLNSLIFLISPVVLLTIVINVICSLSSSPFIYFFKLFRDILFEIEYLSHYSRFHLTCHQFM